MLLNLGLSIIVVLYHNLIGNMFLYLSIYTYLPPLTSFTSLYLPPSSLETLFVLQRIDVLLRSWQPNKIHGCTKVWNFFFEQKRKNAIKLDFHNRLQLPMQPNHLRSFKWIKITIKVNLLFTQFKVSFRKIYKNEFFIIFSEIMKKF